jgi:hypothetical protein
VDVAVARGLRSLNLRLTIAIVLMTAALSVAVAAIVIRHRQSPRTRLDQYAYPPGLEKVEFGMPEAQVRRLLGGIWTSEGRLGGQSCELQQYAPQYPKYEFCFRRGKLEWRSPV